MSENMVVRFREQQALQEEAGKRALYAPAITARHDFIEARMERAADRLLRLLEEGKHTEVQAIMESPTWVPEEEACHTTTR